MEQLDYLFTHNQPHSYSELNSLVEEVMNMHQKFIQSDEEMIKKIGQLAALGTDIEKMSENARESALGHTWEKYYSDVRNAIKEFVANK